MRIVGGRWRGRAIEAPAGRGTTRPTTDRARESIASMILSAAGLDLAGLSVLDAFAGSGAMGLELVSRGAERATLVEKDRRVAGIVRRTLSSLGAAADEARVVCGDVFALAARGLPGAPFGVVFLDPPYAVGAERVGGLVEALSRTGQLAPGAIVVYEHAAADPGLACEALELRKSKTHGITTVDLLVARSGEGES